MAQSLAERTREAAREYPFLLSALAAGVVNYAAAARFLNVDGDPEAVATALSRFADELDLESDRRRSPVSMRRGVGIRESGDGTAPDADGSDPLLAVGDVAVTDDGGDHTALLASGDVDPAALGAVLTRLDQSGIDPAAAGVGGETLVVAVPDGDAPDALRIVEAALASLPSVRE